MDETERQSEERGWDTAKTLAEALPYIQVYDRETVVIKYGGHAMGESAVARQFAADVVLLKLMGVNPVVVHGGGPQIIGLSGKDAGLLTVERTKRTRRDPDSMIEHEVDLGFVGEPTKVDAKLIVRLIDSDADWVPVIAPIGVAEDGQTYNVNADTVAGAIAGALRCAPGSRPWSFWTGGGRMPCWSSCSPNTGPAPW